jgi:malonyl-CoA/methylmalonyl-CoA synthetase
VVLPRFGSRELAGVVGEERATVLFAVPTMYERMLDAGALGEAAMRGLRLATSGSAALAPGTSDLVLERAGWRPLERYGLTETGFVTSNLFDDRRAGTVGLPLPGAELRIADPGGSPCPAGETGEIQLRGAQVFAGYAGQGQASFTPDGWFRSGDLGFVSPELGYLTISGRSKELIVTGGFNVYPREVELVLASLPQIKEVAVAGVPSAQWGEQVTAFVVVAKGASFDPAALAEFAACQLAAYKRPKEYRLVDALPRNHLGKLLRDQLT